MELWLTPHYDARKNFYKKAYIYFNEKNNLNKVYILYSYGKKVLSITKKYIYFEKNKNLYTNTTMRHIRELLRQYSSETPKNLKDKSKIYNITKKDIFKGGSVKFNNTMVIYGNTRQQTIKNYNRIVKK